VLNKNVLLVNEVHDSTVFELNLDTVDINNFIDRLKSFIEKDVKLKIEKQLGLDFEDVPLKIDIKYGKYWSDCK